MCARVCDVFQCDKCFLTKFKWLIYEHGTVENDDSRAINQFQTLHLFIDAEITLVQQNAMRNESDRYLIGHNSNIV